MGRMILIMAVVCLITLILEYILAAWIEKKEAIYALSQKEKIVAAAGNVALALFAIYKESTGSYSALWCFGLWSWLLGLAIYDLKLRELPDCWHLAAALYYLLTLFSGTQPGSWKASLLMVIVLASVLGLVYCIQKNAIGIGDIKLILICSIYAGTACAGILIRGLAAAFLCSMALLLSKKATAKSELPFVPFFFVGALLL